MSYNLKFSIITICKNIRPEIRATCESIISQTFKNYEWIVIDGLSSDGTLEVLSDYKNEITRLISEKDTGIYHAMNKGLFHATGEYILFMNGGDKFFDRDILEIINKSPNADIIYGNILTDEKVISPIKVLSKHWLLTNMLPTQATFYKKILFEKVGKYDEKYKISGDYEMHVRLFSYLKPICHYTNCTLANFKSGGISNNQKFRKLKKRENHQIRHHYFKKYRLSLKSIRQSLREIFES